MTNDSPSPVRASAQLDGEAFAALMYAYRTAPFARQPDVLNAFEAVKTWIRAVLTAEFARGRQQAEQARDEGWQKGYSASEGTYTLLRTHARAAEATIVELDERVAALTQALKDYRAEHKGCRSAVWGDNRCELCKQTDAALTGAQA